MADLSFVTSGLFKMLISPVFWIAILLCIMMGLTVVLWVRKKRRCKFPTVEFVDLGNNKVGINFLKAGWFGKTSYLNGLWWSGNEVLKLASGEEIREFSTEDYHEVNGQRGILCFRDPEDQDMIVPITKLTLPKFKETAVGKVVFKNRELVAEIAPASFRDAAVDCIIQSTKETQDWKEKVIQYVVYGVIAIVLLVIVIVIIKFAGEQIQKAGELITNAAPQAAENCKSMCREMVSVIKGSAV